MIDPLAIEAERPPEDPGVGPHPFMGRSDRWCELPGCNRPDRNAIHNSAPAGSRLLESAKAVLRMVDSEAPLIIVNVADTSIDVLREAVRIASPKPDPYVVAREAARQLRDADPVRFRALAAIGEIDLNNIDPCPRCGAHSLVPHEPTCAIGRGQRLVLRTPDGTTEVLDDYQSRGQ